VHAIAAAVAVGVEVRFDPEILANPLRGIGESRNDLRHAVHEDRSGALRVQRRGAGQHERGGDAGAAREPFSHGRVSVVLVQPREDGSDGYPGRASGRREGYRFRAGAKGGAEAPELACFPS
jgi:hypothetical protein